MTDIIKSLTARIEKRATETKTPCKTYKTHAGAERATAEVAKLVANHHSVVGMADRPARYVILYIEAIDRWVGAIDLTECVNRPGHSGGYLGLAADRGFYTY